MITANSLIQSGIISFEDFKSLILSYSFADGAWYVEPTEANFAVYQKIENYIRQTLLKDISFDEDIRISLSIENFNSFYAVTETEIINDTLDNLKKPLLIRIYSAKSYNK